MGQSTRKNTFSIFKQLYTLSNPTSINISLYYLQLYHLVNRGRQQSRNPANHLPFLAEANSSREEEDKKEEGELQETAAVQQLLSNISSWFVSRSSHFQQENNNPVNSVQFRWLFNSHSGINVPHKFGNILWVVLNSITTLSPFWDYTDNLKLNCVTAVSLHGILLKGSVFSHFSTHQTSFYKRYKSSDGKTNWDTEMLYLRKSSNTVIH